MPQARSEALPEHADGGREAAQQYPLPTPVATERLGEKRMRAFCVKHGYSGRRQAAQLLGHPRDAPTGTTDEALTEALRDAVLAVVTVLTAVTTAIKGLDRSSPCGLFRRR